MNIPAPTAYAFNLIDGIIIAAYLSGIIAVGFKFARRNKTTQGYFIGEHNTPSWVLGLSMLAAKISSVTFLALPAAAFALDWRLLVPYLAILPVAAFSVWILVPFYRRAAHTTVFEYLHARFGTGARLYGAIITLMGTLIRMGAILYLVSIPLSMFTGFSPLLIMAIVIVFCTIYTMVGGIQAVIWTDAIQAIILYAGGIIALGVMVWGIPGGLSEVVNTAMADNKFSLGPMHWDFNERTFWTMLVAGVLMWLSSYTSDQVLIQRYLAAKDLKQARMAGWSSALLCLPTWTLFFFLGTTLYVYYRVNHDPALADMPADNIFPYFILTRMPHGLSGLVIAGIVSAAMGSLSASLNAFATVGTVDIVRPYLLSGRTDAFYMRSAKAMTAVAAVFTLGMACVLNMASKESFQDLSQQISGLFGGVLPAFFLLGLFFTRVNRRVLWQAFPVAFALNVYFVLVQMDFVKPLFGFSIHAYWISYLMVIFLVLLAAVLAWLEKMPPDQRVGLSVFYPLPKEKSLPETIIPQKAAPPQT